MACPLRGKVHESKPRSTIQFEASAGIIPAYISLANAHHKAKSKAKAQARQIHLQQKLQHYLNGIGTRTDLEPWLPWASPFHSPGVLTSVNSLDQIHASYRVKSSPPVAHKMNLDGT